MHAPNAAGPVAPRTAIHRCIVRCAQARDGRGRWRAERDCEAQLGASSIDRNTAAAARRLGEWLAVQHAHAPAAAPAQG